MTGAAISLQQLNALMKKAMSDPQAEGAFFSALLDATVYAHVPKSPPPEGRLQFIQFDRSDTGERAIPFFTDRQKAEFAALDRVGIIAMSGRRFFELTRGASLLLNPNDNWLALYPVEIDALLAGHQLTPFAKEVVDSEEQVAILPPVGPFDLLADLLSRHLAFEPSVRAAYVTEIRRGADLQEASILVAILATKATADRVAQTSIHALQDYLPSAPLPVLVSVFTPTEVPAEVVAHGIKVYSGEDRPKHC